MPLYFNKNINFVDWLAPMTDASTIPGSPSSASWKFLYCVFISFVLLLLCLLGAGLFAKTAFITFIVISFCYVTFILSAFVVAPFNVPIPKTNEIAYMVCSFFLIALQIHTF